MLRSLSLSLSIRSSSSSSSRLFQKPPSSPFLGTSRSRASGTRNTGRSVCGRSLGAAAANHRYRTTRSAAVMSKATVLVTGASGYIGSHVVKDLHDAGYTVRGTVRDVKDASKTAHLKEICPGIELVEADLLSSDESAWDAVVSGCEYVMHVASPFESENRSVEYYCDRAVGGTRSVVGAAARATNPKVKRIVVTSSVAAVSEGRSKADTNGTTFGPQDWSNEADCEPYSLSKTKAERAARDLIASLPENDRPEIVTVNPSFVQGASLSHRQDYTSFQLVGDMLAGKVPMVPNFSINVVSVRDVSIMHVKAMEIGVDGGRYIAESGAIWLHDVADWLKEEFASQGFTKVPSFRAPSFLVHCFGLFDSRAKSIARRLDVEKAYDTTAAQTELGIKFISPKDCILNAAKDAVAKGLVKAQA